MYEQLPSKTDVMLRVCRNSPHTSSHSSVLLLGAQSPCPPPSSLLQPVLSTHVSLSCTPSCCGPITAVNYIKFSHVTCCSRCQVKEAARLHPVLTADTGLQGWLNRNYTPSSRPRFNKNHAQSARSTSTASALRLCCSGKKILKYECNAGWSNVKFLIKHIWPNRAYENKTVWKNALRSGSVWAFLISFHQTSGFSSVEIASASNVHSLH